MISMQNSDVVISNVSQKAPPTCQQFASAPSQGGEKAPALTPPLKAPPHEGPAFKAAPLEGPPLNAPPHAGPAFKAAPLEGPPLKAPPQWMPPFKAGPPHGGLRFKAPPPKSPPLKAPPPRRCWCISDCLRTAIRGSIFCEQCSPRECLCPCPNCDDHDFQASIVTTCPSTSHPSSGSPSKSSSSSEKEIEQVNREAAPGISPTVV